MEISYFPKCPNQFPNCPSHEAIGLPEEIARQLIAAWGDMDRETPEAVAVESCRTNVDSGSGWKSVGISLLIVSMSCRPCREPESPGQSKNWFRLHGASLLRGKRGKLHGALLKKPGKSWSKRSHVTSNSSSSRAENRRSGNAFLTLSKPLSPRITTALSLYW